MKVGKRVRYSVVCCGRRRNEGRGMNRTRKEGWGCGRRREGVEDDARVLFEAVATVK